VELEVLVGHEVRENAEGELDPGDALEQDAVRGHLHHDGRRAVGGHAAQRAVDRRRLRRRHPRLHDVLAEADAERADEPDLVPAGLESRPREEGGGRLAEGAGHADQVDAARRVAVQLRGEEGERAARLGHDQRRRARRGLARADRRGAAGEGLRNERHALRVRTGDGDEDVPACDAARVVGHAAHLHILPLDAAADGARELAQ
jgi:hypothetical protein